MEINIRALGERMPAPSAWIKRISRAVMMQEKYEGELSILFVNDEEIARLNARYRKKNRPTDVLAFPVHLPASAAKMLGDVVISAQTAIRQAKSRKIPVKDEISFLLIHGILHLLGYDHHAARERKIMFQKQEAIFWKIKTNRS